MSDEAPAFDPDRAASLLGKHVLIGITHVRADGAVEGQHRHHGVIVSCDETIVAIEPWGGGELITLPPDLRPFQPAPAGEYRLRSTGEIVVDPDFTASWTVHRPPAP